MKDSVRWAVRHAGAVCGATLCLSSMGCLSAKRPAPLNDPDVGALLSIARDATLPFQDRRTAIAAGYRRIGPDSPAMGEHWVNLRQVIADSLDVSRPAILTYVMVEDRPLLTGVVYAVPVSARREFEDGP